LNRSSYQLYISGTIKLGVSFGVVSLLARWITGNTILSSPETLIKYGLTGGIGYSLMGALALILFGFLAKVIKEKFPDGQTIGDVLRKRLSPSGYWYIMIILLITSLQSLFIQAMGAGILIHILFPIPVFIGMLLFLGFCFFLGGVGGMQRLHQFSGVNVTLIFGAVLIIPVYFYIQEGVHPVYEGIKLFHPYILFYKNTDSILFIFTAILIGFGQILIDRATWQRVFIIKKEKVRITFTLAGVIWATIPLALTSLLMIIMFGRSYKDIYSLLFELVDKIQSTMLIVLFALFCFSAISSAISAELHATTTLVVKNIIELFRHLTDRERFRFTYIFSGSICVGLLLIVSIFQPTPLQLLFFSGNIYAAIIVPMLFIILSNKSIPTIIPFSSLIGALGGYIFIPMYNNLTIVWISFIISSVICLLVYISQKVSASIKH
jgi:Na+/proline symporter